MKPFDEGETELGNLLKSLAQADSPQKGLKDLADLLSPTRSDNLPRGLRELGEQSSINELLYSLASRPFPPPPTDISQKGLKDLADLLSPPSSIESLTRGLRDLVPPPNNSLGLARELGEQSSISGLARRLTKFEEGSKKMEKVKRRVFYSFHYKPNVVRASQVRQIGAVEGSKSATDNEWEKITSPKDEATKDKAIKKWIADQMDGRTCTVVLVGKDTANRKWINHEIVKSWDDGLGVVGIYIHGLKNFAGEISTQGNNPFDYTTHGTTKKKLSSIVKCYNPGGSNSKERYAWIEEHLANAIEEAIKIRKEN